MANLGKQKEIESDRCKRQTHIPSEPLPRKGRAKESRATATYMKQPVVSVPKEIQLMAPIQSKNSSSRQGTQITDKDA